MSDGTTSGEPSIAPEAPRPRRLKWRHWLILSIPVVVAYCAYEPPRSLRLANGRHLDVAEFDRLTQVTVNAAPGQRVDTLLRLRFFSDSGKMEAMLADATTVAPFLFPIADSLGLRRILVESAKPLFLRSIPIAVTSWNAFYTKDSAGHWQPDKT
jgi:hypothetical protein